MGASARAAAESAARTGYLQPWCVDLFADTDLQRTCPVRRLPAADYPHGLIEAVRQGPPGPWMYTGALENHPDVVEAIARERPLWGNPPEVLRRVRDPGQLAEAVKKTSLLTPPFSFEPPTVASDKRYLLKPVKSGGGQNIRWFIPGETPPATSSGLYYQEWIEGRPMAALYLGRDGQGEFLGATHQYVGLSWLHAKEFQYCGSVTPVFMSKLMRKMLEDLGNTLVNHFGLRGLFGVDFVLGDSALHVLEVNPRYTASMELLERATGIPMIAMHASCFNSSFPQIVWPEVRGDVWYAKGIFFARRRLVFPRRGPWNDAFSASYADIPAGGTIIKPGQPVLSYFVQSGLAVMLERSFHDQAEALDRRLFG